MLKIFINFWIPNQVWNDKMKNINPSTYAKTSIKKPLTFVLRNYNNERKNDEKMESFPPCHPRLRSGIQILNKKLYLLNIGKKL